MRLWDAASGAPGRGLEDHTNWVRAVAFSPEGRTIASAGEALREQQTPLAYLAALLEAEVTERAERRERRRLLDAKFPVIKTLQEFRFDDNATVPQATIAALAEGSWIDDRESVILLGESGTGKISERNEKGSLIVTTNLPFGEWTKVFPDPRLAKAVVDRITHKAHIIDCGTESWRLRHGLKNTTRGGRR